MRPKPASRNTAPHHSGRIRAWRVRLQEPGQAPVLPGHITADPFVDAVLATTAPRQRRQRLRLMLMRERMRGQSGSPAYDLARHARLKQALTQMTVGI